jgi:hypothetical protein
MRMFGTADTPHDIPCCAVCGYELHGPDHGSYAHFSRLACLKCESRMQARLVEVDQLWRRLPDSALRPVGERAPGRAMSVHAGIPGNAQVINLTGPGDGTPLGKLIAVEDDWRRAAGLRLVENYGRPAMAMPRVIAFLRNHLPWACGTHASPRYADGEPLLPDVAALDSELGPIVGALKGAVNAEPPARLIASRCLAPYVAGFECPGLVSVGTSLEPRKCPLCRTPWDRETFIKAGQAGRFGAAA